MPAQDDFLARDGTSSQRSYWNIGTAIPPWVIKTATDSCGSTLLVSQDEATLHAGTEARRVYSMETPPYMPHLSLLYSDLAPADRDLVSRGVIVKHVENT